MGKMKRYTNAGKLALARKVSLPGCSIAFVSRAEGLILKQTTMDAFLMK